MLENSQKLPHRLSDPVGCRFRNSTPRETLALAANPLVVAVELHDEREAGGAIIHVTQPGTILALDYSDADDLSAERQDSVRHYSRWAL